MQTPSEKPTVTLKATLSGPNGNGRDTLIAGQSNTLTLLFETIDTGTMENLQTHGTIQVRTNNPLTQVMPRMQGTEVDTPLVFDIIPAVAGKLRMHISILLRNEPIYRQDISLIVERPKKRTLK